MTLAVLLGAPALRLLTRAVRHRRAPELFAGVFFAGTGVGIPLRILGAARALEAPDVALTLNGAGHLLYATGACALFLFTRIVFRPDSRPAAIVCGFGVAAVATTTAAVFATGSLISEQAWSVMLTNFARLAGMAWAFAESLSYARKMKRRVSLGLADPVVADRFRLWALWTGALTLVPLLAALTRVIGRSLAEAEGIATPAEAEALVARYLPLAITVIRSTLALCVPLAVVGIWLSFFPPARYLDRVRSRAAQSAA